MSREEVGTPRSLAVGEELCTGSRHEALERMIFGLALALATEPSKLAQLRQMLVHLQEQRALLKTSQPGHLGKLTNECW